MPRDIPGYVLFRLEASQRSRAQEYYTIILIIGVNYNFFFPSNYNFVTISFLFTRFALYQPAQMCENMDRVTGSFGGPMLIVRDF